MKLYHSFTAFAVSTWLLTACQAPNTAINPIAPIKHSNRSHAHWGYKAPHVLPANWGDDEVNKLCQSGQTQSPINIERVQKSVSNTFNLVPNYQLQDFSISNNGHTIVYTAKNPATSTLNLNGKAFQLLQFHYHIPSEHTVMNTSYPLEVHFVHKNAENQLAVVGVLVKAGSSNTHLQKILTNLPATTRAEGALNQFNVASIMPTTSQIYAYDGSLTTPPCSEQVQWLLKAMPITASQSQINQLAKLYRGNNRPVLPQANRPVHLLEK